LFAGGKAQVVVVKLLTAAGPEARQLATGVGPVVTGPGQLMAVQPLPAAAACTLQVADGILVTTSAQVVEKKFGPAPKPGPGGVQVAGLIAVGAEITVELQVLVNQLLPTAAVCGVQDATGTLVVVIGAGQVVLVNELPPFAPEAVHVPTGTLVVVIGAGQVVVTNKLPAIAAAAVQLTTGTLVVVMAAGQVISTHALPADSVCAEHVATN